MKRVWSPPVGPAPRTPAGRSTDGDDAVGTCPDHSHALPGGSLHFTASEPPGCPGGGIACRCYPDLPLIGTLATFRIWDDTDLLTCDHDSSRADHPVLRGRSRAPLCDSCLVPLDHHNRVQHRLYAWEAGARSDTLLCLLCDRDRGRHGDCTLGQPLLALCLLRDPHGRHLSPCHP
ncbi:MAG: hypothetical protein ABR887_06740 [Methanoregulaceae archaeon]